MGPPPFKSNFFLACGSAGVCNFSDSEVGKANPFKAGTGTEGELSFEEIRGGEAVVIGDGGSAWLRSGALGGEEFFCKLLKRVKEGGSRAEGDDDTGANTEVGGEGGTEAEL